METNHDNRDREQEKDAGKLHTDKDVSGNDSAEENREERKRHQEFGNRKYESNTNHSSADDQPQVDTSL